LSQVPSYFALITRALIVLEGIALSGDPNFDIFAAAIPFARRRALQLLGANKQSRFWPTRMMSRHARSN